MEVIAKSKHIRQTPRKLRLVAAALSGLSVTKVLEGLKNLNKRAAKPILLTLRQAQGNAVNNFDLDEDSLKIKEIQINEGPTLKRWRAGSRGRAREILKRTSHIRLILEGIKRVKAKPPAKKRLPAKTRLKKQNLKEKGPKDGTKS